MHPTEAEDRTSIVGGDLHEWSDFKSCNVSTSIHLAIVHWNLRSPYHATIRCGYNNSFRTDISGCILLYPILSGHVSYYYVYPTSCPWTWVRALQFVQNLNLNSVDFGTPQSKVQFPMLKWEAFSPTSEKITYEAPRPANEIDSPPPYTWLKKTLSVSM